MCVLSSSYVWQRSCPSKQTKKRILPKHGVGSQYEEHVRSLGRGNSVVGLGRLTPSLEEVAVVLANHEPFSNEILNTESSRQDQRIHLLLRSITQRQCPALNIRDGRRVNVNVLLGQGRVVVRGDGDSTTSQGVVGRQFLTELLITDLPVPMGPSDEQGETAREHVSPLGAEVAEGGLSGPVVQLVEYKMNKRDILEDELPEGRDFGVTAGNDPCRRPLIELEFLDLVDNCRNNLDRT